MEDKKMRDEDVRNAIKKLPYTGTPGTFTFHVQSPFEYRYLIGDYSQERRYDKVFSLVNGGLNIHVEAEIAERRANEGESTLLPGNPPEYPLFLVTRAQAEELDNIKTRSYSDYKATQAVKGPLVEREDDRDLTTIIATSVAIQHTGMNLSKLDPLLWAEILTSLQDKYGLSVSSSPSGLIKGTQLGKYSVSRMHEGQFFTTLVTEQEMLEPAMRSAYMVGTAISRFLQSEEDRIRVFIRQELD